MAEKWLSNRLTPIKRDSDRWRELCEAVEEFWDEYFEPEITEIENARSIFTSSDAEIDIRLSEMGTQFEVGLPLTKADKAMAFAQRRNEIHRKGWQSTLDEVLSRDFKGAVVKWLPLYARKTDTYGSEFFTLHELAPLGIDMSEVFLTSRGKTLVNSVQVGGIGMTRDEISEAIGRKLSELRPAHIVYDGEFFSSMFHVIVGKCTTYAADRITRTYIRIEPGDNDLLFYYYFDEVPADVMPLDHSSTGSYHASKTEYSTGNSFPLSRLWSLDLCGYINGEDVCIAGVEGDIIDYSAYALASSAARNGATHAEQGASSLRSDKYSLGVVAIGADDTTANTVQSSASLYAVESSGLEYVDWTIDTGANIGGSFSSVAGIEGDKHYAASNLKASKKTSGSASMLSTQVSGYWI